MKTIDIDFHDYFLISLTITNEMYQTNNITRLDNEQFLVSEWHVRFMNVIEGEGEDEDDSECVRMRAMMSVVVRVRMV
jgi:hypothetical protein